MEYKTAKRMECLPFSGIRAVMEKANKMQQANCLLSGRERDFLYYGQQ